LNVRLSLSESTSLFGLSRYLDRTFAQRNGSAKVKPESEVGRPMRKGTDIIDSVDVTAGIEQHLYYLLLALRCNMDCTRIVLQQPQQQQQQSQQQQQQQQQGCNLMNL